MRFGAAHAPVLSALALLALLFFPTYAGNSTISANVSVICPFYRNMNVSTFYVLNSSMNFSYSLGTAVNCSTIKSMNGTLIVWNSKSTPFSPIFTEKLVANGINTSYKVFENSLPSKLFTYGSYYLNISFNSKFYKQLNDSPAMFLVAVPANIVVTNASVTPTVSAGSPVNFYVEMENFGNLSSTSNAILYINITGPYGFANYTRYAIGAIAAGDNLSKTITIYSVSPYSGAYSVEEYLTYYYNYSVNGKRYTSGEQSSPKVLLNYTVVRRSSPPPPKPVPIPASIGSITYTSAPILVTTFPGKSTVSSIGVYNHNLIPVWINFTESNVSGISAATSIKSLYLPYSQGANIGLLINVSKSVLPGSYVISIPESITPVNGTPIQDTQYVMVVVESPNVSKPSLLDTITAINNSKGVIGEVEVVNPTNRNLYNTTASVSVPGIVARNISQINISGFTGNVSFSNGAYNIEWYLPVLPAGATATLYYTVKNATNIAAFESSPISFTVPSQYPKSSIKIFDIN
ncbi:MAG: hypothetical protein ACP5UC_00415, partial [Candidatus Micrarchaeia archaeon]